MSTTKRIKVSDLVKPIELEFDDGKVIKFRPVDADSAEELASIVAQQDSGREMTAAENAEANRRAYEFIASHAIDCDAASVRKWDWRIILHLLIEFSTPIQAVEKN